MIDALFGSKTRVKLLHLFLNNPGKAFYVREITRLIDEQINSVRRELANMLNVGVITSDTADNKLYYQVNQRFEYYVPFRAIFANEHLVALEPEAASVAPWQDSLKQLKGVRIVVLSGIFTKHAESEVDIVVVGDVSPLKLKHIIQEIEAHEGREVNYAVLSYDDFYYRLSMRDKFITSILGGTYSTLVDADNILDASE